MAKKVAEIPQLAALRRHRSELEAKLQAALRAVDDVKGEMRGIDHAIALLVGKQEPDATLQSSPPSPERRARGSIKAVVLEIMDENAADGLRTPDVVEQGVARGIGLDRNSVASLLSRLTKDGVLNYDRDTGRYRPASKPQLPFRSVA